MYKVIPGDTFELIARKQYGDESQAQRIANANPGTSEPLVAGTSLAIPVQPGVPKDAPQQAKANGENEVALLVGGRRFRFWEGMAITRSIDAMDTLEITAPFEEDQQAFREAFRPFTYKLAEVTVGGNPLFTGTLVGIDPILSGERRTVGVSAYSLPGVLNDCTAPASAYPLEFTEQGVRDIAKALTAPFGLAVSFDVEQGAVFDIVAADVDEKVLRFLTKIAQQRNLIISSTTGGALLFQQSVGAGDPVGTLSQGSSPVVSVVPSFDPQNYYSHVTGIDPVTVGLEGSQFTVKNEKLTSVVRPITFKAPDTSGGSTKAAVEAKAGRMFGSAVSYSVGVSTWRDSNGNLWAPNTTVKLQAPGAMIYNPYEFLIRSVVFSKNTTSETATLTLVLPGAFSGQAPETLPWDE